MRGLFDSPWQTLSIPSAFTHWLAPIRETMWSKTKILDRIVDFSIFFEKIYLSGAEAKTRFKLLTLCIAPPSLPPQSPLRRPLHHRSLPPTLVRAYLRRVCIPMRCRPHAARHYSGWHAWRARKHGNCREKRAAPMLFDSQHCR